MLRKMLLILALLSTAVMASETSRVNVFVGTEGDHGQLHPGATVPFGMVVLGPDLTDRMHTGYNYTCVDLNGFSHTRVGGVGCSGGGGTLRISASIDKDPMDKMIKATEVGRPGYYGVKTEEGIQVDLTAAERVGYHKYTFPDGLEQAYIKISPDKSLERVIECSLEIESNNLVTGMIKAKNVCGHGYNIFYYAVKFAKPFDDSSPEGKELWCSFNTKGKPVTIELKVGLSTISVEQAIAETESDIKGWHFNTAAASADRKWAKILDRVEINNVPAEMQEFADLFYTCLYRSFRYPFNATSSNGQYRVGGDEKTVRNTSDTAENYIHYSGWSSWDDFRKYSLISLLEPQVSENMARSIVECFSVGPLPQWGDGYWPVPTVRNEFIGTIVADAFFKDLSDFDLDIAYNGLKESIRGNDQVEKPYQYYMVMKMAEALGKTDEVEIYKEKALEYKKYWCSEQRDGQGNLRGFFTADGNPVPMDKVDVTNAIFYQGNLWHYRYWVPHDINGLIELRGSKTVLADELEYYFVNYQHIPHNEPPLAYPFLFDYMNRPWRAQYWSRHFLTDDVIVVHESRGKFTEPQIGKVMKNAPDGYMLAMDDDTGAMASNYIFNALGLFPSCVGDPYYTIGSPLFPEVKLNLENGKTFEIIAKDSSIMNKFIESATLNGQPYNKPWIEYKTIMAGGKLEFQMAPVPNFDWGSNPNDAPPSMTK